MSCEHIKEFVEFLDTATKTLGVRIHLSVDTGIHVACTHCQITEDISPVKADKPLEDAQTRKAQVEAVKGYVDRVVDAFWLKDMSKLRDALLDLSGVQEDEK